MRMIVFHRFEAETDYLHYTGRVGSVDSLLSAVEESPAPAPYSAPAPPLPVKTKIKARRLEQSASPPPLPSRRSMLRQRKVHYAEKDEDDNIQPSRDSYEEFAGEDAHNDDEDEVDNYQLSIPRLPSVKDLAAKFQPKLSPELKPKLSMIKVNLIPIHLNFRTFVTQMKIFKWRVFSIILTNTKSRCVSICELMEHIYLASRKQQSNKLILTQILPDGEEMIHYSHKSLVSNY